ncbi:unnamed protein product [Adineta ricciae]|uniref:Uncharacterized protein n=1 Tax=Adineta ricciae TaxID=249248 RepID=A0A816B5X1_ADIRI|nr:unnamed protein product [Adineta ricciae]CAF1606620.1 unnamed protein product [Adineta ricciae]
MLSEAQRSTRSPTESVQTDSVRTGPTTGVKGRLSPQSSITEEDSSRIPPPPPLPPPPPPVISRAPVKSSSASASSSSSSSSSKSASTVRTKSSEESRPIVRGVGTTKPISGVTINKSTPRRMSSDEKSKPNRQVSGVGTKPSQSKHKSTGAFTRISARDFINDKSNGRLVSYLKSGKSNQSVFEKVDTHDGHTTYLGSGNYCDLEDCIRDCLSKNRCHTDLKYYSSSHDYSSKPLTRASVLEDYSYDGIIEPKHHSSYSSYSHLHDRDYYSHLTDYHCNSRKHAGELSLDEIRKVNDHLAKYGIPVFSHHDNPHHSHHSHHKPHSVNEIVSACRLILNEPRLAGLHSDGSQAVHHVWDAIHNHPMPQNNQGYASPAVRGVASHLFPSGQPPYDPVHGVSSHLFGQPQAPPNNPSHFFAPAQPLPSYNPGPSVQTYPYGSPPPPPPQQQQQSSGQSVLSRLLGSH